ncbi:MAG TPA: serine/threonine-protein kinase, partial [Acidobacteriota bacterium]|nr:serine/threonine-protein kinase [Acidobacteriota bacterium]
MYIGKYEVLTQVGSGGMGLVYQARLPETSQVVALKAVHPELVLDSAIQRRFLQEIEILAQLPSHPNLVKLHHVFSEAGKLYLVTDFIAGESLKDRLQGGPLPVETALSVFSQVLSGLEAIHQHGIIHRDIKPSNILLDHHGQAYISDFGIAEQEFNSTQSDDLVFVTAKYAAPEILAPALGATAVKPQIDIYALGMVLYEALVGDPVFRTCFSNVYA